MRGHGLEFGLWFEPEMINAESELFRAHPDWVLADPARAPLVFRNQLVLDLGRAEVRQYLFDAIDAVLSAHAIGYVKWDHNRDLYDGAGVGSRPGIHAQTLGFYDLLDRLRAAHPSVAWESCASGGARIDLRRARALRAVLDLGLHGRPVPPGHPAVERPARGARPTWARTSVPR